MLPFLFVVGATKKLAETVGKRSGGLPAPGLIFEKRETVMDLAPKARNELAAQLARVNDEIKSYPQPIARCDAQLAGLLEERARIRSQLEHLPADE
jgi:hypothetical protein